MQFHYRHAWYYVRKDRPANKHAIHWIGLDESGTPRRQARSFPTKKSAMAFKQLLEEQLNSAIYPEAPTKTWEQAIVEYDTFIAQRSTSYRYFAFRALRGLADPRCRPDGGPGLPELKFLRQVSPQRIDQYFADLRAGRVLGAPHRDRASGRVVRKLRRGTPVAVRQDYTALHAFFALCDKRGHLKPNPMESIPKPRDVQRLVIAPSLEEWVSLLRVLENPGVGLDDPQAWYLFICLGVCTGIDRDDLLRITREPVRPPNWEPFRFKLGEADTGGLALLSGRRTKTGGINLFGLPKIISDHLAVRVASLIEHDAIALFPWRLFQRKQWQRIRQAANFPYKFRALRSAAGTQQAEARALDSAADLLGHENKRTTKRHYADQVRVALALARGLTPLLPSLPPLPAFRSGPAPGKPGRRPLSNAPAAHSA